MNRFTKNLSFTILLTLLVLIPNFILVFVGEDSITATPLKSFVFLVSCFSFVFVGCILIKPKYYFLFLSPVVLLQYLEVLHIFLFKTPTSTGVFIAFLQTNFNESREFLTSQFQFLGIALATLFLYGFLLLKLDTSFYFSLRKKLISAVTGYTYNSESTSIVNEFNTLNLDNYATETTKSIAVTVFPNPFKNKFTIEIEAAQLNSNLILKNSNHDTVLNKVLTKEITEFDTAHMKKDIYYLSLWQTGIEMYSQMIMKE